MKKELEVKLEKIKKILDDDFSYLYLVSVEEKSNENLTDDCNVDLEPYYEVKNKYDDLRFGDVVFWVDEETFEDRQIYIMIYEVPKPKEWICIGEVEPYPLMLNVKTGIVSCIISEPGLECKMKEYVKFEEFINEYVLGEKYLELGMDEEWNEFMKDRKII